MKRLCSFPCTLYSNPSPNPSSPCFFSLHSMNINNFLHPGTLPPPISISTGPNGFFQQFGFASVSSLASCGDTKWSPSFFSSISGFSRPFLSPTRRTTSNVRANMRSHSSSFSTCSDSYLHSTHFSSSPPYFFSSSSSSPSSFSSSFPSSFSSSFPSSFSSSFPSSFSSSSSSFFVSSSSSSQQEKNRKQFDRNYNTAMKLGLGGLFFLALTYVSVPLYQVFCRTTGFGFLSIWSLSFFYLSLMAVCFFLRGNSCRCEKRKKNQRLD